MIPRTNAPPGFKDPIFPKSIIESKKPDLKQPSIKPSIEKLTGCLATLAITKLKK